MNTNDHRFDIIRRCRDGEASTEELAQFASCLREDANFRQAYVRYVNLDVALSAVAKVGPVLVTNMTPSRTGRNVWLSWRPLAAAAAGLVLGMFCTSVLFAYVRPTWETTITLLKESFESGTAPMVTGVPTVPNRWSGDYTEVVEAQQGVKPSEGSKMLRLSQMDSEGKSAPEGDRYTDLYRLVDMRPYRDQLADGGAVVQFSAGFNAFAFPKDDTYFCRMSLRAYDTRTEADGSVRVDDRREGDELAVARAGRMKLDHDPATWQRLGGDLRLPPNTNFLMVRITIHHKRGPSPGDAFAGHYLDDVLLTMTRRPPPL